MSPNAVISSGSHSTKTYNGKVGLALLCPITSQIKGYPFEVTIPDDLPVNGVILSDQVKSLDWKARSAEKACSLPEETIKKVLQRVRALIE
jgi:mRNA interferase MazF